MSVVHCIERARERYGVELTVEDIRRLEATICVANRVRAQDGGSVHLLLFNGVGLVTATVGEKVPRIATFLPPDTITSGNFVRGQKKVQGKRFRPRFAKQQDGRTRRERVRALAHFYGEDEDDG